jgi:hypothetical protein
MRRCGAKRATQIIVFRDVGLIRLDNLLARKFGVIYEVRIGRCV